MKIISGMLGVFMLTLLPLPLHAEQADYAVVDRDTFGAAKNLDSLDVLIRTFKSDNGINTYFQNGNLRLDADQVLLIRGGHGTIGADLGNYKHRSIMNSYNQHTNMLIAYGCYVKRMLGKATTYVMVFGDSATFAPNINQWGVTTGGALEPGRG